MTSPQDTHRWFSRCASIGAFMVPGLALWLQSGYSYGAALLLVGALYEQRESQGDRQFYKNPTFENLLNPYRVHA